MRRRRNPALVVGDWNLSVAAVGRIADQIGGQLVEGKSVDHAIVTDDVRVEIVRRNLPRGGSDHPPILVTVSVGGERLRVLWWNVYVGQEPADVLRAVCELADAHQPDIIALGETYRVREELGRVPGYRRHQGRRGRGARSESAELAILTRRNVPVRRRGWLRMTLPWIGPKHGLHHGPRRFPAVRVELGGTVLRILAVHLPTGGYDGPNAAAVRECARRIVRWVGAR